MTKHVLTAFAAAAIVAAPAIAQTPIDLTWEGHRIVGVADQLGDTQVIKGKDLSTGRDFELHVRKGYVQGTINDQLVAFPAPRRRLTAASAG